MGYPNSVFSPAVRSNGQTIDAAHVNDLQTEVTALETLLLGTISHSVNITGASTLATLQAAASTFSVRPVMPPPEMAFVSFSDPLVTGSSAQSTIAWNAQLFVQTAAMHSTTVDPQRLIPQTTGVYRFEARLEFTSTEAGQRTVLLVDSSGATVGDHAAAGSSRGNQMIASGYKRFDVTGGYVTVQARTVATTTNTLNAGQFVMQKL